MSNIPTQKKIMTMINRVLILQKMKNNYCTSDVTSDAMSTTLTCNTCNNRDVCRNLHHVYADRILRCVGTLDAMTLWSENNVYLIRLGSKRVASVYVWK